ncbi:hypothetical protein GH714_033859 [Hevea brasiliensis]|uniref:Major facilitator superfamily (MFS) profile domain-containing protein n=1 Tax=Hevea brasiliensis TaxID=3981 RepID=A0A6A6N609_HEVBR|nr:hypothetical protein GH714_033859 [Hevea brasiliensis]
MKQEEGEEAQKLVHGINIEIAETKLELTVDEVVEGYVGSLGISQLLHVFLVSLAWIFDSQNTLATIFSDAQPPSWRCISPHLHADNTTVVPAMAAASLCSSIGDSKGGGSVCGLPPGTWEWVGGNRSSTIAEWGLICDRKFLACVPASLFFLGSLLVGGEALAETKSTEKESLWTTRWAAKRMIVVMITGFGVGFVYYGVQLNVENLNFNLYFTVALNALMEIPAVVIGTILSSFTNRRLLFSQSAFIAGVSCILCIVFSHGGRAKADESGGSWPQLIIEGIGFMAASTAFNILYIYCVELFPTNVRNSAVSMLRQALMLGASISPLMVVLGRLSPSLSFLVFGFLSIFSGVMSSWLPETKNAPLYETLKQQEEDEKQSSEVK